jgi:TRAP-type transport system periplasmic protein
MRRSRFLAGFAVAALATTVSWPATAQTITLHGASQFGDDHPFTKSLVKFQELVKQ